MSSFRNAFDPPDPASLAAPLVQSVQCAIYMRLRKTHGNKAGALGWLIVRLGQPEHRDFEESMQLAMAQEPATLAAFSRIVRDARAGARAPGAGSLCDLILDGLGSAEAAASVRASRAAKR